MDFDILKYMSGLTGFLLDKDVLQSIAFARGVADVTSFSDLTTQQKDLLRADILYSVYIGPTTTASANHSHGSYSKSNGSQNISEKDKERIFAIFTSIYRKYNDDMLELIEDSDGTVSFVPFEDDCSLVINLN